MIQTIRKAWGIPELRKKIIFTLLILLIFRIGNAITVGPYVTLARNAVPATGFASLNNLHLSDWLKQMDFEPLTDIA